MRPVVDIWENLGELEDQQTMEVLSRLFTVYESELERDPDNRAARDFFRRLDQTLTQVCECNSNRR